MFLKDDQGHHSSLRPWSNMNFDLFRNAKDTRCLLQTFLGMDKFNLNLVSLLDIYLVTESRRIHYNSHQSS
jgi:hypothetical protein